MNISKTLANILCNRGILSPSDAENFLSPRLAGLRDPFEIPGIIEAAKRVLLARERGEKVLVYGDYDVDGVTGTSILVQTFKLLGIDCSYYIPHRYGEGYSLSLDSVKKIAETGVKLLVTVDCGIGSAIEVEEANALGMDVVITDHHNLPRQLPKAVAIVNPKQIKGEHPSKYLSGAGVAFKFAWALLRTAGIKDSLFLTSLLDLASLGTISDVVPLTGENRILAVGGLNLINERKRLGIKQLADSAALRGKIGVNQIYFAIAPRINAAGRLEHASKSVDLLLTEDPQAAKEMAEELNRINSKRQSLGSRIKEEVFDQIDADLVEGSKLVFMTGQDWHPGVIGIVASQVADIYFRPTILIGINEGVGRGSARSIDGFNIYELLDSCRELFLDFGGHEGAAGFEIKLENVPELKVRLTREIENQINQETLVPRITIDSEIELSQLSLGMVSDLDRLQPFGEGNPQPVFMLCDLQLADYKTVGAEGKHLKAWFTKEGVKLETIGFGMGKMANNLNYKSSYDLAFNLDSNEYNGFESVQLSLVDIRQKELTPKPPLL